MKQQWVIDRGNTRVKIGIFRQGSLFKIIKSTRFGVREVKSLLLRYPPSEILLASVVKVPRTVLQLLSKNAVLEVLDANTPLPIRNLYRTPETLGVDRLAGAVKARKLFPGEAVLVIDAGTCIKYDFVDRRGNYRGGAISPGLNMRLKAMHAFTDRLPLLKPDKVKGIIGNDTLTSMMTGAIQGAVNEMHGFVNQYRKQFGKIKVVLTGGDAAFLSDSLNFGIFAAPDLVLEGLYEILLHARRNR
ncbi:MAG: type III pantothenate kinase [Bacteroidota bacterium]